MTADTPQNTNSDDLAKATEETQASTQESAQASANEAANEAVDALNEALSDDALSNESSADPSEGESTATRETEVTDQNKAETLKANKKVKTPRQGTGAVTWLALLLSLVAVSGTIYTYWQQQQFTQAANENLKSVENSATTLKRDLQTEVQSQLNSFSTTSRKLRIEIEDSNEQLAKALKVDVQELGSRLTENEQQVIKLKGFSDDVKYAYIRSEIEYFLQTANNRIQLAQDAVSAQAALEAADERLTILRDPSLTKVRALLRDEIQALKAVEQPDIEKITLTLSSISKQVSKLPLRMDDDASDYFNEEIELKKGEGIRVGLSNVWRNMRGTLDKLVEVRDATPSDVPLLSVGDVRLVYANLDIQLQSARLAALKGDAANYQVSLDNAERLLNAYFDAEQKEVKVVIDSLVENKDIALSPELPDISGSLLLLRGLHSADKNELGSVSESESDVEPEAND